MKKIRLFFITLFITFLLSSCQFNTYDFDTTIKGCAFKEEDSSSTYIDLTDDQAEGRDYFTMPDGTKVLSVDVIETIYVLFGNDGLFYYYETYNPEYLEFFPDRQQFLVGTYKIKGNKIKINIEGDTNLNRTFRYCWDEDGNLELHCGFLDQTLFLRLTRINLN